MEIVLQDKDGNEILSPRVYQWDQGVPIIIRDFLYPVTESQRPYLHFYNVTKQHIYAIGMGTEANPLVYDASAKTLTGQIPNQLLMESYPITVHVYLSGGTAGDTDASVEARTVYTATICVEPRMQPDHYEENDNVGEMSSRALQEAFQAAIGTPISASVTGYYDATTGKMYSDSSFTTEITGNQSTVYQDIPTGDLYTYSNGLWSHWDQTVTDAIMYCKTRADACDNAASSMHTQYQGEVSAASSAMAATFSDALGGCIIRVSNHAPTAAEYGNETRPMITFVIEE